MLSVSKGLLGLEFIRSADVSQQNLDSKERSHLPNNSLTLTNQVPNKLASLSRSERSRDNAAIPDNSHS
jgi:hypothetical protein